MVDEMEQKLFHFLFKTSVGTIQFLTSETFGTYGFLGVRLSAHSSIAVTVYVYRVPMSICALMYVLFCVQ